MPTDGEGSGYVAILRSRGSRTNVGGQGLLDPAGVHTSVITTGGEVPGAKVGMKSLIPAPGVQRDDTVSF